MQQLARSLHFIYHISFAYVFTDAGVQLFRGSPRGSLLNNDLAVCDSPGSGFRLRIFCRSDSRSRNVGQLIGPSGEAVSSGNFFDIGHARGEVKLENIVGIHGVLTATQQGVYTCRIRLQSGETREINFGIYPSGFNSEHQCTTITVTVHSVTLICMATKIGSID